MGYYFKYLDQVRDALWHLVVTTKRGEKISSEDGLSEWCDITREVQNNNKTMYFIGNGASAMMAGHMAADASKNAEIRSLAFNDIALLTAVSNDISYEEVFAVPLRRFANPDDVLVTISSSGSSPNIITAIHTSREIGMQVITLSGMSSDNKSRELGDLNFYVPANTYGHVEVSHQVLLHCWLDMYMESRDKK